MTTAELQALLNAAGPRARLVVGPTPLQSAPRLAELAGCSDLTIKRDDVTSPDYGGSKVRALEYLLGASQAEGARIVGTVGATGSHHALATAICAAKLNLGCRVVLVPQPDSEAAERRVAALRATGCEVFRARRWVAVPSAYLRGRFGTAVSWIPAGASSALGALGAARGLLELAEALAQGQGPPPECIVLPAGSCGTAAGIAVGCALLGMSPEIVAVRVAPRIVTSRRRILGLANAALRLLARTEPRVAHAVLPPVTIVHDELGRGYAWATDSGARAAAVVHEATGLRTDTTYTGKAWAHILSGALAGRRVLFWNTLSAVEPE